jgi:16S rRNA C967 or C1407 C5-methylase (RsmB/RsmF family)
MGSRDEEVTAELPAAFWERLESWVEPHRLPGVRDSFGQPKRVAFRVNRLSAEPGPVAAELERAGLELRPLPWLAEGFHVADTQRELLTRHPLVELGQIYIHNPSSMLTTLVLAPQPGETVMDLAASPGGKTLHMAAQMRGEGFLSAVEPVQSRFYKLKDNLRRGGASFVRTYQLDGRQVPRKTGPRFDRILLDAPCSGEARFHTSDPTAHQHWGTRKIRECRGKQAGLIQAAWESLRPGGRLLYCTCSFAPEENEGVVANLLRQMPGPATVVSIDLPIDNWQPGLSQWQGESFPEELARCRRILPDALHDGLFMALLEKA